MYKEYFHGFLHWLSGGAAATSLALFVFVPTLQGIDSQLQKVAIHAFLVSLPFLVFASALGKEISLLKGSSERSDKVHALLLIIGGFAMVGGLAALCAAIDQKLVLSLLVSIGVATFIYSKGAIKGHNKLVQPTADASAD